jgi:hypothetical protein
MVSRNKVSGKQFLESDRGLMSPAVSYCINALLYSSEKIIMDNLSLSFTSFAEKS